MQIVWGAVLVVLSLVAWGGQAVAWLAPATAVKLTLMEAEDEVEPALWADIRSEAAWDSLTLWTMLVAGILLLFDNPTWSYFGLVGGGMYAYFAGRGIFTRVAMLRRGYRVGTPQGVKLFLTMLAIWGAMGLISIAVAVVALSS